ncbi:MAG TPA: hypothetical protein VNH22_21065 [Blastocatellia bacterium]|jgi:hypothetical protein|nr:hypothetical protein [Blastocatellia bacterium]
MKRFKNYLRASISLLLALALTSVLSLHSFAAPEIEGNLPSAAPNVEPPAPQSLGTLRGNAVINGNKMKTGATVLTGALVEAGSETAVIDLGALGRIEFRPGSKFTLTYSEGMVDIRSQCGSTYFAVRRGQAELRRPSGDKETFIAGQDKKFDGEADIVTAGGTDLVVDCGDRVPAALYVGPGLIGFLALLGLGSAVAIGIAIGDNSTTQPSTTPPVTPIVP